MPTDGAASAAVKLCSSRSTENTNRRVRYSTIRNQNLATIANIESEYKGKIDKVMIIGKFHENGASFAKYMVDVRDYVSTEYDEGNDLELLIETQVDDFVKAANTKLPKLSSKDDEDKEQHYMFQLDYCKMKLFGLLCSQYAPTLLTGIKSQLNFTENTRFNMSCGS